jgi:hypothetical protein
MTLFQIIEAIWQGYDVVIQGCFSVGIAHVGDKVIAEWDVNRPAECWMIRPDSTFKHDLFPLVGEDDGGVPSSAPGICPAAG